MMIREAGLDDVRPLLEMLREQHAEAAVALSPISDEKATGRIGNAVLLGAVFIAETAEGEMAGSIGGVVAQADWWSEAESLADYWFYVRPRHRASRAGYLLFKAFKETAERKGLDVRPGVLDGNDVDRKDKFFGRFGLRRAGAIYMKGRR